MELDYINGLFELGMALAILMSIRKLHQEKMIYGIHWTNIAFPLCWGIFNLLYYPSLGQWFSFFGGVVVVTVNLVYLGMIIYYSMKQRGTKWDANKK